MSAPESFNAADYLVYRRLRAGDGERTALICHHGRRSYADVAEESRQVASGLAALGVRPEERVMFFAEDSPQLVAGILGAMHLGAIAVPMSTMLTADDLHWLLTDARARVLVTSAAFADTARDAVAALVKAHAEPGMGAPDLTAVITMGGEPAEFAVPGHDWSELLAAGAERDLPVYDTWVDSPALWLYTSGTTGSPKAAMHRHGSIRSVCENYGRRVLGVRPDDVCLSVAKLFFAYGLGNSLLFPFSVGAATVLEPRKPTPELAAEVASRHRPSLFFGVPTFYSAMLNSSIPPEAFHSVRQGVSAGESLPAALYTGVKERFGFEVLDGLGSTEALHIFLSNRPGAVRPASLGTPVPGYRVQIRDESDGSVITEPNRAGTLYVSGDSMATGYWCRAQPTRRAFQGEWLRTGDTYQRNVDGTYTYLGRSDEMIKAGGIWVSPSEVEARLLEHPDVVEAAVVGVPDEYGLAKPVAAVVTRESSRPDPDELIEFCRAGLAAFKRPRRVVLVDSLPKTATGKLQRYLVRAALS